MNIKENLDVINDSLAINNSVTRFSRPTEKIFNYISIYYKYSKKEITNYQLSSLISMPYSNVYRTLLKLQNKGYIDIKRKIINGKKTLLLKPLKECPSEQLKKKISNLIDLKKEYAILEEKFAKKIINKLSINILEE